MMRTDAIVLGAGIVGVSVALHLAKRGLSVTLIDRRAPGEETSYGNAGIIESSTIFPPSFPSNIGALLRIALKRAPEANYHLSFLPTAAPWLMAFRAASRPEHLIENARVIRPFFARALAEHEALIMESRGWRFLRKTGWLKVYRTKNAIAALQPELDLAAEFNISNTVLDTEGAIALEPELGPVFSSAVHWRDVASVTDPLGLTRAYAARFEKLGGVTLIGDARTVRRARGRWQVDTAEGPVEAELAIAALGPWSPDLLEPLGVKLPLGVKRGYHRHFRPGGNASLSRPVLDGDKGYVLAPMDQGIRLTTGVEIAARDSAPSPAQFERLMPYASELFPLGSEIDAKPWMGSRPCFPDSRPVMGPAPGHPDLWLAFGHAHWGLTLGPATGRLIAEMITGQRPFCDPAPYSARRFLDGPPR